MSPGRPSEAGPVVSLLTKGNLIRTAYPAKAGQREGAKRIRAGPDGAEGPDGGEGETSAEGRTVRRPGRWGGPDQAPVSIPCEQNAPTGRPNTV